MDPTSAVPAMHPIVQRQTLLGGKLRLSADMAFVLSLIIVCGATAYIGIVSPIQSFAHDLFFFLDNAYRITQGQVSDRDFSSAWGPIMFLIDAAGLNLSSMSPDGIGYANALFGGLIAIWAFLIVRSRWPSIYACATGLFTALLIMAPFALGDDPINFSVAMTYNRYGYALFGVLLVECASGILTLSRTRRHNIIGSLSTGVVLGLLVFLKISYAMVAIPFAAACMTWTARGRLGRLLGISTGFVAVIVAMACYLRFDLSDMLQDIEMAASARRLALQPMSLIRAIVVVQNAPLLVFAFLIERRGISGFWRWSAHGRALSLALLTVAAGCLLLVSNQQTNSFPLNAYAAVILLATYAPEQASAGKPRWLAGNMLVWLCCLPLAIQNVTSLAYATVTRTWPGKAPSLTLNAPGWGQHPTFAPVVEAFKTATDGEEYVAALNEGLALIARRTDAREGVLVFDEFNPFNYLLSRPSPKGGFAAAAYDYVFSDASHPSAKRFFGNTDYIIVRKYKAAAADRPSEGSDVAGLMHLYGRVLEQGFSVVEETAHWVLWRRRGHASLDAEPNLKR